MKNSDIELKTPQYNLAYHLFLVYFDYPAPLMAWQQDQ